ncbi:MULTISPECIES: DUF3892 domain-containing protein [unclassified Pseudomonas]|uniref:DUF3892 domain-containing protein n=1 Tax=Pseudomonas sp. CC120222-01a TaxID=1378075 RepID=UPI000D8B27F1|nr:uncharacterized protein DUF3892 [Pseudomonas sp. CC120222-01a]
MPDFCITRVKYDAHRQHIVQVEVSEDLPAKFGTIHHVPRGFVADLIRMKKASFATWMKNAEGKYVKGADVHVIDETYLSTDRNSTKRDNLGSLPEY